MTRAARSISTFERIEAVLRDTDLYRERPNTLDPTNGGRPRTFPGYMVEVYASLIVIFTSARAVDTELRSPDHILWDFMCRIVRQVNPNNPEIHLPADPPSRPWYIQRRDKIVADGLDDEQAAHTAHAVEIAAEVGLCNPAGPGSTTHPDISRMPYGDGKVLKSLFNSARGDTREIKSTDPLTDEVTIITHQKRFDPDAKSHVQGDKKIVVGNKFAHVEVRGEEHHARVILGVAHVPDIKDEQNSEADILLPMIMKVAEMLPGTQGVLTDGVLRGVHIDELQRERGLIVVNPVTAEAVNPKTGERTEKEFLVGYETFHYPDRTTEEVELWTHGGGLCQVVYTDDGTRQLDPLDRTATLIRPNKDGTYRGYVEYEVPDPRGGRSRTRRERTNGPSDERGKGPHWRAENIRQIPPGDPDYERLYGRRADAESINRGIDDSFYLRRAHSIGAQRQLYDLLAYARTVNALALHLHRKRRTESEGAAA